MATRFAPCGHPIQCSAFDDYGDYYCQWCKDIELIEQLRRSIEHLREQLRKKAFIVEGGSLHAFGGQIGYLEIRSGTVILHPEPYTQTEAHT